MQRRLVHRRLIKKDVFTINKMSLLDEIKAKGKVLKNVETTVTHRDGRKYKESCRGLVTESLIKDGGRDTGYFYIEDTSMDELAHEVLPGLFIGSQDAAFNFLELEKHGINCILNVAVGIAPVNHKDIKCRVMPMYDIPEFNIKDHFYEAIDFITSSMKEGPILVHCNAGISRSAAIIAAFLMREKRMPLDKAMALIKTARPCAKPNEGFMKQLRLFENELLQSREEK